MPGKIRLQSKEKEEFPIDIDVAKKSKTIRTMLEDLGIENDEEEEIKEVLPLPNIRTAILRKVIDWCTKNKDEPEPAEEPAEDENGYKLRKKIRELSKWETVYLGINKSMMIEIVLASNYLHIPGLLDLVCMRLAMFLKGKTTEEMIKEFPELGRKE
jgi:S-phase kinase-associated protein 1